jgi:hypothetical protein
VINSKFIDGFFVLFGEISIFLLLLRIFSRFFVKQSLKIFAMDFWGVFVGGFLLDFWPYYINLLLVA